MSSSDWTDPRVERLTALWREGLSAAEIAERLGGVTRNAVLGKLHRLHLLGNRPKSGGRKAVAARPQRPAPPRKPSRPPKPPWRAAPKAREELEGQVQNLEALTPRQCRWPIGDPLAEGFAFCGRAAAGPYCPTHAAVAYLPPAPRRRTKRLGQASDACA